MKKKYILKSLLLLSFLAIGTNALAQTTKQRADTALGERTNLALIVPITLPRADMNANNAIDDDDQTYAELRANAGLVVGLGYYSERLTLTYSNSVSAGTNYYIKTGVPGNNGLFGALLGGSLGDALGTVLGAVLLGNESATFELLNGSTSVISGNIYSNFANNPDMEVAITGSGDYYILMNPTAAFDRLRVNLQLGSVAGLLNNSELDVYDAFYYDNVTSCDIPLMTSYTATGGILGLSVLPSNPVINAHYAIDDDTENTYSTIGLTSLLGLNTSSTVEQFFHMPAEISDRSVKITMRMPASLLNLTVSDQSSVVFYHNGAEVGSTSINENILDLDLLGLINVNDTRFSFAAAPRDASGNIIPFDKVGLRINIPVGLNLLGGSDIQVYDFAVINDTPITARVCTKEFIDDNNIREIKFNITDIIPNYNTANTYVVSDSNGNNIDLGVPGNEWQPLGSYIVRGITGSADYCPDENVSILAVQDTRYRINGKIAISMPLDADDNGTPDAQHTFLPEDYSITDLGAMNADVSSQYGPVQIFDENTLQNVTGQTITYSQIGSYNYYVKTTNSANPDCDLVRRVTVYVFDKADCEYRFEQLMANTQITSTVSLLGIPLGGTAESARAVDLDLSTHGSVFNVVSLLGIGTTSQKLLFTEDSNNKTIAAGTPITVKIGQDYSLLQVIGGLTVQALDTNSNTVGRLLNVGEIDLANVLVGDNIFEFTFIPENNTGTEIAYSGVQVNLGSVLGLANTIRVYGAFIDERISASDTTCNPNITIQGAEIPGNADAALLLNTSSKDVWWGTQDIGLGVGTLLSSTLYGYQAADAVDAAGTALHGTPDYDTYALFNSTVGALNQMSLTVKFKETARPGDKVRMVLGKDDLSILDVNILGGALTAQRYMGSVAIGEPVEIDANSFIQLDVLSLINSQTQGKYVYTLEGIGAPFDRVELRLSNVVNVQLLAPKLRVYDVSLLPYFSFDSEEETTTLCTSAPFEIEKSDPCTSYELSYAYPTIDNNDNITGWNDITGSEITVANENEERVLYRLQMREIFKTYNDNGILYMKVQTTRQGCLYGDTQYLKVKIAACGSIVNPMIRTRLQSN